MRFFTHSVQRVRKNPMVMPSTNLSGGIALNRVFHSIGLSFFATGSSSNRKASRPSTINVRLAAVRRLAYEAPDAGLLSPDSLQASVASKGPSDSVFGSVLG
jgi:hypothetical protein